jgi:hypothetical protein
MHTAKQLNAAYSLVLQLHPANVTNAGAFHKYCVLRLTLLPSPVHAGAASINVTKDLRFSSVSVLYVHLYEHEMLLATEYR